MLHIARGLLLNCDPHEMRCGAIPFNIIYARWGAGAVFDKSMGFRSRIEASPSNETRWLGEGEWRVEETRMPDDEEVTVGRGLCMRLGCNAGHQGKVFTHLPKPSTSRRTMNPRGLLTFASRCWMRLRSRLSLAEISSSTPAARRYFFSTLAGIIFQRP